MYDLSARLFEFTTTANSADDVADFLTYLGAPHLGAGVLALAPDLPHAPYLFDSVYQLCGANVYAIGAKYNCASLAALGVNVLRSVDAAGAAAAASDGAADADADITIPGDALAALVRKLDEAAALVRDMGSDGWLLRVMCNGDLKTQFAELHGAIIGIFRDAGMHTLPGIIKLVSYCVVSRRDANLLYVQCSPPALSFLHPSQNAMPLTGNLPPRCCLAHNDIQLVHHPRPYLLGACVLPPAHAVAYRDYCRPLRRMLKQLGGGSLTAGVRMLKGKFVEHLQG